MVVLRLPGWGTGNRDKDKTFLFFSHPELLKIVIPFALLLTRYRYDGPAKFQRVLGNEEEMVRAINRTFPDMKIRAVRMEEMDICAQVRLAHESHILLGVHGAGLVHLWWMQQGSKVVELIPSSSARNPTFGMLARLSGTRYSSVLIREANRRVAAPLHVVVNSVIDRVAAEREWQQHRQKSCTAGESVQQK